MILLYGLGSANAMADAGLNRQCDQLAAAAVDADRPTDIAGVNREDIVNETAIPACESALNADAGNAHIMFNLARALDATEVDIPRSAKLYKQAAGLGSIVAMLNTGFAYRNGHGFDRDPAEAAKWYTKAAEQGFAMAQTNLGHLYRDGIGVPRDYVEARKWYEKAVAAGSGEAMNELALLYDHGNGVKQDFAKARALYEQGITAGNTDALNGLGWLYDRGLGVPAVDHVKANEFYKKAVDAGNAQGMDNLGESLLAGEGIAKDEAAGLALLNQAVQEGNGMAANNLAKFYAKGEHVAQDFIKAGQFFFKAVKNRSDDVEKILLADRGRSLDRRILLALQDEMQSAGLTFTREDGVLSESAVAALQGVYDE